LNLIPWELGPIPLNDHVILIMQIEIHMIPAPVIS